MAKRSLEFKTNLPKQDSVRSSAVRQHVSGSALRVFSLATRVLVATILTPFVLHSLGTRMYGLWSLVGSFLGYYGVLDFGLTSAVCQHISVAIGSGKAERCSDIFNTSLRLLSLIGAGIVLLTVALAASLSLLFKASPDAALFSTVTLVLGVGTAMGFPLRAFSGVLLAQLRYDIQAKLDLLTLLIRTLLVVLVLRAGGGIVALSWAAFLSDLPSAFLLVYLVVIRFRWVRVGRAHKAREIQGSLLSYGRYMFFTNIAERLRFQADPFVITAFIGLTTLAHYKIASLLAEQFLFLVVAVMAVIQPLFSRLHGSGNEQKVIEVFFFALKISTAIASFLGCGIILWGKAFIVRWMGPAFLDTYPALVVLTIGTMFALWQNPLVDLLWATARHQAYAWLNAAEGTLNLVLSLIFVQWFGMFGVALATLVALGMMRLVVIPWWFCRITGILPRRYFGELAKNVVKCAGVIAPIAWLTRWGVRPDYAYLSVSAALASVMYGTVCLLLVFNGTERRALWTTLRPERNDRTRAADLSTART